MPPARLDGEKSPGHAAGGQPRRVKCCGHCGLAQGQCRCLVRASARIAINFGALDADGRSALYAELEQARKACASAANHVLRTLQRADEDSLDAFGRIPKRGEWKLPKRTENPCYKAVRAWAPDLASGVASALSRMAFKKWMQTRFDALVLNKVRPARYTTRLPIPVRAQDYKLHTHDGFWDLHLSLRSGRGNRLRVPLKIRDDHQRTIVENVYADIWRGGELKIEQDSKRPEKWYVRVAYKRLAPKLDGGSTAAVHRGLRNMFVAVTDQGRQLVDEGHDVEAYLKQMQARRKRYQRQSKLAGRGGHGRKRTLRPIEPLFGKAARWRKTRAQTAARRMAQWLAKQGVSKVYIEDLTGIRRGHPDAPEGGEHVWQRVQSYPLYDHGARLVSCLEELGIVVATVPAAYVSQRCPKCGTVAEEHRDLRRWRLRCSKAGCGFSRDLDVAAGMNLLARGEAGDRGEPWDLGDVGIAQSRKKGTARKTARKSTMRKGSKGTGRKR